MRNSSCCCYVLTEQEIKYIYIEERLELDEIPRLKIRDEDY